MTEKPKSVSFVVQPGDGESFWQPVPANGYAEVLVSKRNDPSVSGFSSGIQVIAPGSHIREHQHGVEQELLFFFEGKGRVVVNGEDNPVVPGTMVYAGPGNRHKIVNDGPADLKMMWVLMPGGLEDFFQAIGRPRTAGDAAPKPFQRPENVAEIEAKTVFAPLDNSDGE